MAVLVLEQFPEGVFRFAAAELSQHQRRRTPDQHIIVGKAVEEERHGIPTHAPQGMDDGFLHFLLPQQR